MKGQYALPHQKVYSGKVKSWYHEISSLFWGIVLTVGRFSANELVYQQSKLFFWSFLRGVNLQEDISLGRILLSFVWTLLTKHQSRVQHWSKSLFTVLTLWSAMMSNEVWTSMYSIHHLNYIGDTKIYVIRNQNWEWTMKLSPAASLLHIRSLSLPINFSLYYDRITGTTDLVRMPAEALSALF